jgi:DNA-directed RNA polymerase subunit M/transcription elongation factor TFIIS
MVPRIKATRSHARGARPALNALQTRAGEEHHVVGPELPPEKDASSTCPKCGTEMVITRVRPILFGGTFEELSLGCRTCGHTTKIRIERS